MRRFSVVTLLVCGLVLASPLIASSHDNQIYVDCDESVPKNVLQTNFLRNYRYEGFAGRSPCFLTGEEIANYNYRWRLKLDQIGDDYDFDNRQCGLHADCLWQHGNVVAVSLCVHSNVSFFTNSTDNFCFYLRN